MYTNSYQQLEIYSTSQVIVDIVQKIELSCKMSYSIQTVLTSYVKLSLEIAYMMMGKTSGRRVLRNSEVVG